MMVFAAKNVGMETIPRRLLSALFSSVMYSCQEEKPSGTTATLISTMEIYANAAIIIAITIILLVRFAGYLKCAVSKDVTSKPTNAHGARTIRLKTAYPLLSPSVPKEKILSLPITRGRQKAAVTTIPISNITERAVCRRWRRGFAAMKRMPNPASASAEITVSPR